MSYENISAKNVEILQSAILNWHIHKGIRLSWRESNGPFKILVAEFLLQKTNAEKVKNVFGKIIKRWPSPQALSRARISSILKVLQPLGLRYRANRLRSATSVIVKKIRRNNSSNRR